MHKEIDVRVQATSIETTNGYGLCITCNNAPTCFFRASRGPALFCELFDDYAPPMSRKTRAFDSVAQDAPLAASAARDNAALYTGLCVNCGHQATCTHSKSAGGIWHCEDYD